MRWASISQLPPLFSRQGIEPTFGHRMDRTRDALFAVLASRRTIMVRASASLLPCCPTICPALR